MRWVKWDAVYRDRPGKTDHEHDRCVKRGQVLQRVVKESLDAELLILATWSDLGEETGIHRNYDYYVDGHWPARDHFMQLIPSSQSEGK